MSLDFRSSNAAILGFQSLQFSIDVCKLRSRSAGPQVVGTVLFLNERFHFSPKKPKPGVSMHGLLLVMQLLRAYGSEDFFPR